MTPKEETARNPSPFVIRSIIGFNLKVPIMNLTSSEEQPTIAYASGHILTIFSCENNRTEYLLGHEQDIVSVGIAKAGKEVVTSDEHLVNIWKRTEKENGESYTALLKTINEPFIQGPILSTGLSVDGEYLVLASRRHLHLWILRNDNHKPDAVHELPDDLKIGRRIVFCRNNNHSNSFVVTTETNLLFCRWNAQTSVLETHSPRPFPGINQISDSSYCTNYCKGVSIAKRSAIIWSDTTPGKDFKYDSFENRMECRFRIKFGFYQLRTVSCCNGFVIISDCNGEVKFYDENMNLCFSYELIGQIISSISFVDQRKENQLGQKDKSSLGHFFVSCESGQMYKCNLNTKPILIQESAPVFMKCFDLHPKRKIICGGRSDGRIFTYDYYKNTYDKYLSLPLELSKQLKSKPKLEVATCLNFSCCGRYIAAGTSNGYIVILNTITLSLFQKAVNVAEPNVEIEKVIFSKKNDFIVYLDACCTVGLLHFQSSWKLRSKIRVHDSQIVYMSFRETQDDIGLVTISEDYGVAEYTIQGSGTDYEVDLVVNSCRRVDFLSVLKCCITLQRNIMAFPNHSGNDEAFLTTDEKFKFQIRNLESFDVINTFAAPITENEPITKMCHVQRNNEHAVAFSNENIIGLQHLPIDGNPSKYLAMVGHPRNILVMKMSYCNKYLFTIGTDDPSVYVWKINISAVLKQYRRGGTSLRPFCNLIPDGVTGHLFTEMQDLFFHIQIKLQKDRMTDLKELKIIDGIPISEAVDFMRGIGFFPNEAKVEYILDEMKYYTNDSSMITFEGLVKLYVNYRPPFGYSKSEMHQTLTYLGYSYTMQSADTEITRERLLEICTSLGERMDENDAAMFLNRLNGSGETDEGSDNKELLANLRSVYTMTEFLKYILGVE